MSKTLDALRKSLILRAYGQPTTTIGRRDAEQDADPNGPRRRTRLRSPTGDTGLPCDWLFSAASEPVLIVDATTERVLQANPAAVELLETSQAALIGAPLAQALEASSTPAIRGSIERARTTGRPGRAAVRTAGDSTELSAKVSFLHAGAESYLLVRLASKLNDSALGTPQSPVLDAIEGASVGFLMTDAGLRVEYANQAFIDLAELPPLTQILGKSLVRWLEFSETDMAQLHHQMLQCQATTVMTACLRTERNLVREVEVCAVAVPDGPLTCWGFTVRELPRLN